MAAEQPHLYLITGMRVYFVVLVDGFEDVRGGRPVGKLEVIESFFIDVKFVTFLKIFNRHVLQNYSNFAISVLKHKMCFHVLLFHFVHVSFEFHRFHAFVPPLVVNVGFR
jgi:hypothetical protein